MNRRIVTRVVEPGGVATGTLFNREACEVYWITAAPNVSLTAAVLQIFDGFDIAGKLVWEDWPDQNRHCNFIPPIHCEQALFVQADADMGVYTIAWRPKKWDRPKPMEKDVIKHPEA